MVLQLSNSSEFDLSCAESESLLGEDIESITTELKDEEQSTTCTATITSISVRISPSVSCWGLVSKLFYNFVLPIGPFLFFGRVRVVVSLVGKLVLPAVVGVYYAYLRNKHTLVEVLPAVVAFLTNGIAKSLSSVQGAVTYPNKFDPILRVIKLRYRSPNESIENVSLESDSDRDPQPDPDLEECVTCSVLSEPPEGVRSRADIVFIHGLHGSLVKTWRQGDWKMAKDRAESVEIRRRASTSCLQDTKPVPSLKRCASVNSAGTRTKSKIAKDDFNERTICDCETLCQCDQIPNEIKDCEEPKSSCWPRDWLPKDCPGVRVIAITYTTDPYLWRPVWIQERNRTSMEKRSKEMMDKLLALGVGNKPIVWVGHSKGGLFIKQMLVNAWENKILEPSYADLCLRTKAIMFYSVPHRGSSMADFTLPFIRRSVELLEIKRDCDKVLNLHKQFLEIFEDERFQPEIFSFIETSLTFMAFCYLRIVAFESADPGIGVKWPVPLDHREICKPTNRKCFLYQELVDLIYRST